MKIRTTFGAIIALAMIAFSSSAINIDPTFDQFGALPEATFGGSGIPNSSVAVTHVTSGNFNITLGLTAHQRYNNPAVNNNGAGTFYAVSGGDAGNGKPNYARWNIGYYADVSPDLSNLNILNGYSLRFYFDKNPAVDNDVITFVPLEPSLLNGATYDSQDSWNLGMGIPFGLLDPTIFNPSADGEYEFFLGVYKENELLGGSGIKVVVNDSGSGPVPDGGSSLAMIGLAGMGLIFIKRKIKS